LATPVENSGNFKRLSAKSKALNEDDYQKYADILGDLLGEFQRRFSELDKLESSFKLFETPLSSSLSIDNCPLQYQFQLIDLRTDRELRNEYEERRSLTQFYQKWPRQSYPKLHKNAAELICMFGSTYICEQLFSVMKINKSRLRSNLTDENLTSTLRLASAESLLPNTEKIVSRRKK